MPAICLVGAVALVLSCATGEEETLKRMAPGLSGEFVEHLVNDESFASYAGEVGEAALHEAYILLRESIPLDGPDSYGEAAGRVLPSMQKIAFALDSEYGLPWVRKECRVLASAERGIPYRKLHIAQQEIYNDPALSTVEKLEALLHLLPQTDSPDLALLRPSFKYPISTLYSSLNDGENYLRYLRAALSDARELEGHGWVCQLLGVLGTHYITTQDLDSMSVCWDEALDIAVRHKLAQQAARIYSFYAWHYAGEGRLSLAHELFNEAQEVCRKYRGGYFEIRYIQNAMEFQADLGSWEIVDRLYKRVRVLERQYFASPGSLPTADLRHMYRTFKVGADMFEARLLMEKGDVDGANQLYADMRASVRQIRGRIGYPQYLFYWAEGLVGNGRDAEALPLIREGMVDCRANYLPWLAAEFALLGARAELSLGQYDKALRFLDEFDELHAESGDDRRKRLRREWSLEEEVRARVYLAMRDRGSADAALENGLERLEASLATLDRGAQGYLWLSRCEDFRRLLSELTADDPVSSYGAELYWRSLYRHLGGYDRRTGSQLWTIARRNAGATANIYDHLGSLASEASGRVAAAGCIHLVYEVGGVAIRRWTVDENGIRAEVLDAEAERVREQVSDVWLQLSTDPGDADAPITPSLVSGLHTLARDLLPVTVLEAAASGAGERPGKLLLISGDGYLSKIPFEALNVGDESRYRPLLESRDVAYLRRAGGPVAAPGSVPGPGVILVTDNIPPRLRDRYPLAGELKEALAEGRAVAELNPAATFLYGASATKSNLMLRWKDARFVYLAAHVLRDPEVPYLALIPMSTAGERPGPDAAYLDISDIRSQSLDACEIVVLSGCSSGAPYLASRSAAPSLGDVFLDAGAGAVVQTFWAVADQDARRLMTSWVGTWETGGMPGVKGLSDVRRARLHGPGGIRHPFGWASWSIKLERI